jgi:hypothetical protein
MLPVGASPAAASATRYRSARSPVLVAAMLAPACVCLALAPGAGPALLVLFLFAGGLPLWMLFGTGYELAPEALSVRCGPLRWRISLANITGIEPVRDFASGPALALDRLAVDYGPGQRLLISPTPRADFLADLAQRRAVP